MAVVVIIIVVGAIIVALGILLAPFLIPFLMWVLALAIVGALLFAAFRIARAILAVPIDGAASAWKWLAWNCAGRPQKPMDAPQQLHRISGPPVLLKDSSTALATHRFNERGVCVLCGLSSYAVSCFSWACYRRTYGLEDVQESRVAVLDAAEGTGTIP